MGFILQVKQPTLSTTIQEYRTNQNAQVFMLPLEAFPGFWVNAYLVIIGKYQVLIDTGSGYGNCNDHLKARLYEVGDLVNQPVNPSTIDFVLLTHGHIDHYGGLPLIQESNQSKIGIHELDLRVLINPEERLKIIVKRLYTFLSESGVPEEKKSDLIQMYQLTKLDFSPVKVDFTFESIRMKVGPFEILHVPGHCAGHVVIRLHDILFCGDHVLNEISPHQNPESLVRYTGLGHYLNSLKLLSDWAEGISLTLAGHNGPIEDLSARIKEIVAVHQLRLRYILDILNKPKTIYEVSLSLFPGVNGFNDLLALEETGAHIEYLYQRGILAINNLESCLQGEGNIPFCYCVNLSKPRTDTISW